MSVLMYDYLSLKRDYLSLGFKELEFANHSAFPATGEDGRLYIALDTNEAFRWNGTGFVAIGGSGASAVTPASVGGAISGMSAVEKSGAVAALLPQLTDALALAVDGGSPSAVYAPSQTINGGTPQQGP